MDVFYYSKSVKEQRAKLIKLKKDALDSWGNFSSKVFNEGVLR